ncbi:MAG: hypothetical protein QOD86_2018 [Miltoncostaeaceae bacterium]|jgi:hypothetical protein|nr:hypothetical protein [Miltoncostaeaceae bacterium]
MAAIQGRTSHEATGVVVEPRDERDGDPQHDGQLEGQLALRFDAARPAASPRPGMPTAPLEPERPVGTERMGAGGLTASARED